jgi:hypothetical protein
MAVKEAGSLLPSHIQAVEYNARKRWDEKAGGLKKRLVLLMQCLSAESSGTIAEKQFAEFRCTRVVGSDNKVDGRSGWRLQVTMLVGRNSAGSPTFAGFHLMRSVQPPA